MSRSYKRDKYVKWLQKATNKNRNPQHHIWLKGNYKLNRFMQLYCPGAYGIDLMGTFNGHKTNPDGRHIVSGIVRMKLKEEARQEIESEIKLYNNNL